MALLQDEVANRRTFAIISHPDAGKTTLTEKLLLFGGAIQLAGAGKAKAGGGASPPAVYEEGGSKADQGDDDGVDAIRAIVEKDPSTLESIFDWVEEGQPWLTIYKSGQTPLLYAVLHGKPHAVKTLLDLGANVSSTEQDGYNVLHVAGVQGRAEILELLLVHRYIGCRS